jgi:hypothetical protein
MSFRNVCSFYSLHRVRAQNTAAICVQRVTSYTLQFAVGYVRLMHCRPLCFHFYLRTWLCVVTCLVDRILIRPRNPAKPVVPDAKLRTFDEWTLLRINDTS